MPEIAINQENQATQSTKPFLAGNFVKVFIFFFFGFAVIAGNFLFENRIFSDKTAEIEADVLKIDYSNENVLQGGGVIRFDSTTTPVLDVISSDKKYPLFDFKGGRLWGNFLSSGEKANIVVGKIVVMPNRAVFDLSFDGSKMDLDVYNGDVYLGFLPEGVQLSAYVDPYSTLFMNRFLVARDNHVSIPMSKITEEISPLLYLKLAKEFKYTAVPSSEKESDFVKDNFQKDSEFVESVKQKFESSLSRPVVDKGFLNNVIFQAEEWLTFVPSKKRQMFFSHLFTNLDNAMYFASKGLIHTDVLNSLNSFDSYLNSLPVSYLQSEDYYFRFDEYVKNLSIFSPEDEQYEILEFLLNKKIFDQRDLNEVVDLLWIKVYEGIDDGDTFAYKALDSYYNAFDKTVRKSADLDKYAIYATFQNQLFDNLFLKYPLFYKDGYFAIKGVFENVLIEVYAQGQLNDEVKQSFISTKIDFLKRLKKFFFEEQVDISEAKKIYSRLFEEISNLMPSDNSSVAVIQLFESELSGFDDFFGYLTSPEYQKPAYGSTHKERYDTYLKERETILSFENIQKEMAGGMEFSSMVTISDVVDEIESAMASVENLSELSIGSIKDTEQRFVDITAVLGGYPFSAVYDRDTSLVKEVHAYNELVSENAVNMESLLSVFKVKFANLADKSVSEGEYTLETDAQRTARFFVAKIVSEAGFIAEIDDVSVVDEQNAVYRVEKIGLAGYEDITVTFDVVMNGEFATNIYIKIDEKPQVISGQFTLEELAGVIAAEYGFISGGKEKPVKVLR